MSYINSRYLFDFMDDGVHVVYSMLTTSFIGLDEKKFQALMTENFEEFSDDEKTALLQMGFIYDEAENEYEIMQKKRKQAFQKWLDESEQLSLVVLPTTACNARCYYCYERGIKKERMSAETVAALISFIKERAKTVHIKWFGGEPTLEHETIDQICKALASSGIDYSTSFVSNGYLMNESFIRKAIEEWNFNSVQITLDSIGADYDRIKNYVYPNVSSAFDTVINNIQALLSNKVYVNIRINYNPEQYQKAIEVIDFIRKTFGNNDYLTVYTSAITDDKIKRLIDYDEEFNPHVALYEHLIDAGYLTDFEMASLYPSVLNCTIHYNHAYVVDTCGNLYKCQHAIINKEENSIGTIYADITDTEKLEKWSSLELSYDDCKNCKYLPVCMGGCRFYALNKEQYFACFQLKNSFVLLLKMLYKKLVKGGNK